MDFTGYIAFGLFCLDLIWFLLILVIFLGPAAGYFCNVN